MAEQNGALVGFAYGEDLEQGSGRSLGYRLLAPVPATPWSPEVEALARRLQAAPYPEHWPATDLFCSVLLADGQRLVALARYGLSDHTPDHRRGGLELVGFVTAAALDVPSALSIYRWLQHQRDAEDDLYRLGGTTTLEAILAAVPPGSETPPRSGPVPVLPVRLWQEGAFLFAAAAPCDPDHHLGLLDLAVTPGWQWLPLVGPDFPLANLAQRGSLIAWTPHLAGVAIKVDRREAPPSVVAAPRRFGRAGWMVAGLLALVLAGLLGANLWTLRQLQADLAALPTPGPAPASTLPPPRLADPVVKPAREDERERFAQALYRLLSERGGEKELQRQRPALLERYETLARRDPDLRLTGDSESGKLVVATTAELAGRSTDRIEQTVRRALSGKGFSDRLVGIACDYVREQFTTEADPRGAP